MCGIFSIFFSSKPISDDVAEHALRSLRHRGPDDVGVWWSADRTTTLAHARLSIVGLDNGAQPIANENNNIHIIVNGEFYGFEGLREGLISRGHRFRTRSDSEIALHLYEEKGIDCLESLRGEYAFVIWDERAQRVFAARDRFGVKPLYYAIHENSIYFSSEIKAILEAGVPARWDAQAVADACHFVAHLGLRTELTFRAFFRCLPPLFCSREREIIGCRATGR